MRKYLIIGIGAFLILAVFFVARHRKPLAPGLGLTFGLRATAIPAPAGTLHFVALTCMPSTSLGVTSYNFYRSTTSGSGYTNIGNSSTCAFTDTLVNASTTYYYVATAVDAGPPILESGFSNQFQANVPATPPPVPPTGLTGAIQ
jgi:hypothetical protein